MIPARFVRVETLPMTANGKLDKSALPAPSADNLLASGGVAAPSAGGPQKQIADLVASLLGQPSVGTSENFFLIGGHSMLGVQLVARIRDMFGVKLTLRQLFKAPTVVALATEVERLVQTGRIVAIWPRNRRQQLLNPLGTIHIQRRKSRSVSIICLIRQYWQILILFISDFGRKIRCIGIRICTPGW